MPAPKVVPKLTDTQVGLCMVNMPDLSSDPLSTILPDILLYGPSGVGKTICAATLSEQIPADATFPLRHKIEVKDTVSLDFDKTARFSREVVGIYMPSIDLSQLTTVRPINIIQNDKTSEVYHTALAPKEGETLVGTISLESWESYVSAALRSLAERGVKNVIFDTLTSYDRVLEHNYKEKNLNGYDLNRAHRSKLVSLHVHSRTLGMRCVFIAHSRMPVGIEQSGTQASINMHERQKALGAGDANIFFDLSTNAAAVYRGNTSAVWPLVNEGTSERPVRRIRPYGTESYEGKCQLPGLNYKGEEPNLRAILEKSRKFLEAQSVKQLTKEVSNG